MNSDCLIVIISAEYTTVYTGHCKLLDGTFGNTLSSTIRKFLQIFRTPQRALHRSICELNSIIFALNAEITEVSLNF